MLLSHRLITGHKHDEYSNLESYNKVARNVDMYEVTSETWRKLCTYILSSIFHRVNSGKKDVTIIYIGQWRELVGFAIKIYTKQLGIAHSFLCLDLKMLPYVAKQIAPIRSQRCTFLNMISLEKWMITCLHIYGPAATWIITLSVLNVRVCLVRRNPNVKRSWLERSPRLKGSSSTFFIIIQCLHTSILPTWFSYKEWEFPC